MGTVEGIDYRTGQVLSISWDEGRITAITSRAAQPNDALSVVAPGLVDLQINGFRGMDFNTGDLTTDVVSRVCQAVVEEGVTSFYPTVITNSDEAIRQALSTIGHCMVNRSTLGCMAGIHLEGPFISSEDGPRGAHHRGFVKSPDWDLFSKWQDASHGNIKVVTLAPELPGAMPFIEKCVDSGVLVAIGHSAATPDIIRDAIRAGARMSTHLGNGSHVMLPRHSNYVFEQLAADELGASLIADGFHLPPAFLKIVLRTKGHRVFLVSDAVALCGMPPGEYDTPVGGKVTLQPNGKLHLAGNEKILAGSAQMLTSGIANLVRNGLSTLPEAWSMASLRPSTMMNLPVRHGLVEGAPADLVIFRMSGSAIEIQRTYKQGDLVYRAPGDVSTAPI